MSIGPYTEDTLAAYLITMLGEIAPVLSWAELADVQEPINDALLAYGTDDPSTVTALPEIAKLRAYTLRAGWRAARDSLSARYDVGDSGQDLKRSQMHKAADVAYQSAAAACEIYDQQTAQELEDAALVELMTVQVSPVIHTQDPYDARPPLERTRP